jgi:predicted DNA-binding transcriptional regulator AlpA
MHTREGRVSELPARPAGTVASSTRPHVRVPDDEIMTKREVTAWLKISPRTLERLHSQGKGPRRLPIGKQVRYLKSTVLAWLRNAEVAR